MKEPTINIVVTDNGPLEITCDAPWPAEKQALYQALFDAVRAHLPKPPEPGEVTRDGFIAGWGTPTFEPHPWPELRQIDRVAWAAAESAAREGYVNKADIRSLLENPGGDFHETIAEICRLVEVRK